LVYVAASSYRDVVGEKLERNDFQEGEQEFGGFGDANYVLDQAGDVFLAFDCDSDDAAAAGGDFLDIRQRLFVAQAGAGVSGVLRRQHDDREGFVDEGVGAMLHFAGGVALSVDITDFLELECAFEGDGEVDSSA